MKYLITLLLCLFTLPAWGATWYVQKSNNTSNKVMKKVGAWPITWNASGVTDNTDIDTVISSAANGDIIEIDGGASGLIYSGTELSSQGKIFSSFSVNKTLRGSVESNHQGLVTLSGASSAASTIDFSATSGAVISNLKLTGCAAGQYQLIARNPLILNNVIIGDGVGRAIDQRSGANLILNNCQIKNNADTSRTWTHAGAATTTILNNCKYYNNCKDLNISGVFTAYNTSFIGNYGASILVFGAGSSGVIKNCIFSGNGNFSSVNHIILNATPVSVEVSNSVLLNHPINALYGYQNITDAGGNVYTSPKVKSNYGGQALIALGADVDARDMDNSGTWDGFQALMSYANAKGIKVYAALERSNLYDAGEWDRVRAWEASGNEAHAHTFAHSGMIDCLTTGALKITGPVNATYSLAVNKVNAADSLTWTGTLTLKVSGVTVRTINISTVGGLEDAFAIASDVNTALGASGWAVTNNGLAWQYHLPNTTLTPATDVACSGAGAVIKQQIDAYLWREYVECKVLLEAELGHIVNFVTYPGGQFTTDGEAWLANAANFGGLTTPFLGGRSAAYNSGSYTFSQAEFLSGTGTKTGSQVMEITGPYLTSFIGSTNIKQKVDAYIDFLAHIGGVSMFYMHTFDDYDQASMQATVDALLANPSAIVILPKDIVSVVRQQTNLDGDGLRWGRTVSIDQSNYRLRPGSPAINAGVNVGLTTDFAGKPTRGLPDIGAYEYRPVQKQGFGFTSGFGF